MRTGEKNEFWGLGTKRKDEKKNRNICIRRRGNSTSADRGGLPLRKKKIGKKIRPKKLY